MDDLYIPMDFISTGVVTLTIERTMNVFFEKRRTSLLLVCLSYLLFWITLSLQFFITNVPLVFVLYTFALIIVSLNYGTMVRQRIAAIAACTFVLNSITQMYNFFQMLWPAPFGWIGEVMELPFVAAIVLSYLAVLLVFPRIKNIRKAGADVYKLWLPFALLMLTNIVASIFILLEVPIAGAIAGVINALVNAFIIFYLYNTLSRVVAENVEFALHAKEKEYYLAQCELMQESLESIKSLRHDMKFHLATARDFTASNKAQEATDYLNSLLGSIEENEMYSNTKNIVFDSIINFKLQNAKKENIKLDIKLLIPASLHVEVADIVTIIGNLLDNALDAVSKVEDKQIKLDIEYSREILFIRVENTFDGLVMYDKDENIITRKSGKDHGRGLKNIRKSVEEYNGHVEISHDESRFSAGALLYVRGL